MNPDIEFAREMKVAMDALGITQAECAQLLTDAGLPHIYHTTVSKMLAGSRPFRLSEAVVIARTLGLDIGRLYGAPVWSSRERLIENHLRVALALLADNSERVSA
ncbi:helix-turn-helix transcriptional regulator [Dietzia sp. ANT_WB102]|uniref:helix-turn-helix domain-containing protein n=1 Tax=Dietzia sp. ANT_WB102 TaxID=2597345 RepID=UPI0011EE3D91|nr:helix-turn-helix transcriptional regulator [Dietzia sp. ANT_WB102]KAA0916432.1 helix-turn-helix transcriptional regulator [Dietzia sp. ANT_WB102]